MALRDVFKGTPFDKLAQDVQDVCALADEALNALTPPDNELRKLVDRVRTTVPSALRQVHEISLRVDSIFDHLRTSTK